MPAITISPFPLACGFRLQKLNPLKVRRQGLPFVAKCEGQSSQWSRRSAAITDEPFQCPIELGWFWIEICEGL
jgi:hypothetical protein